MISLALVWIPAAGAVLAALWRSERTRPLWLPAVGAVHVVLAFAVLIRAPEVPPTAWLGADVLARAVLPVVALLFLVCAAYAVTYLRVRDERSNRVFVTALLVLLSAMSLAIQARHLGLLWVAVEAATLSTVPLLHFNGTPRAFEATWKYLLVGGTGMALSLLGTFFLGYAALQGGGGGGLTFAALVAHGATLSRPWVLMAWVLLLTGYGTKMGLAPMHTWKPDAYGEAPGIIGALLAGGLTTVAFVAILRVRAVVAAVGAGAAADRTLLGLGLVSACLAALFLVRTVDYKRMLAYSSIEQMGVLGVGASLGPPGIAAALFHVWSNALTEGALFLAAGNIRRASAAQTRTEVAGMATAAPASSRMLVVGMLAVTMLPPFGPFFSELRVLRAALSAGQGAAVGLLLVALWLAFVGMSRLVFAIVDGRPRSAARASDRRFRERLGLLLPPMAFLVLSVWVGLATPSVISHAWRGAATLLTRQP